MIGDIILFEATPSPATEVCSYTYVDEDVYADHAPSGGGVGNVGMGNGDDAAGTGSKQGARTPPALGARDNIMHD